MNLHRYVLLCVALLLPLPHAYGQETGVLNFPPLHLELPATWVFDGSKEPIEGHGPGGEKLLISVLRKRAGSATDASPTSKELARNVALGLMSQLASKNGLIVVRPVTEVGVPDGKAGYSVASEKSGVFGRKAYFVQYIFAASGVLIYLTFEGEGEVTNAMRQFDTFIATQRWDE